MKDYIAEKAALLDFKSKYAIDDIDIESNKHIDVLLAMYHLGYDIHTSLKESHIQAFKDLTKDEWLYLIKDLDAILSQLTEKNYHVLLNDLTVN